MAAPSKAELETLEAQYGLTDDGLSYQLRCSRIAAVQKGELWEIPEGEPTKRGDVIRVESETMISAVPKHPLFGKTLLITPLMTSDKNRSLYFDEVVGHEIKVEEMSAGSLLWGESDDIDRVVGDYVVVSEDPNRAIVAKTSIPKVGQEITFKIGTDLVPVVRGNDGQRGYIWSFPTHTRQYEDTVIQLLGLKTLIQTTFPEVLDKFSGKPTMMYIDGLVIAASIPQTNAILKELRRREMQDARLGFE